MRNAMRKSRHGRPAAGFTLLELLIVVLVVAILATLAVGGHRRMVECATMRQARETMRSVIEAEKNHFNEHGVFTDDFAELPVANPNERAAEHHISYAITEAADDLVRMRAEWRRQFFEVAYSPTKWQTSIPPGEYLCHSAWCGPKKACAEEERARR